MTPAQKKVQALTTDATAARRVLAGLAMDVNRVRPVKQHQPAALAAQQAQVAVARGLREMGLGVK